ncbi:mannitol dehydrogenase [Knoellia aerolata DSM 18566]|uniref:Mannitol dehydrogenase n=1 Tax=Knoellia aerolata DSM 18566 TaxID=1385519 RepID=A0A0A0JZ04_9MICO|nr:mannitol dehydrogenase [Knoellia aerolata DSM 18566]
MRRLSRDVDGRPAAPVRIVHLGLGNFFRAHAAWYTDRAPGADAWGIAAFTGRSPAAAEALSAQDGLYTLLVRGPEGPRPEIVSSLSAVHPGDDLAALRDYFSRPELAVVTLTVTEAGYRRAADGGLDREDGGVSADVAALLVDPVGGTVTTTPGRLVAGLLARRARGAGALAIVPNDNVPDNGAMVARVVTDLADAVDPTLRAWVDDHVSWVTTMVDRITPRTTDDDRDEVRSRTGVDDPETVPTEPYSEWVLAGSFPGGRPDWEAVGARVVDDVAPFEQRKLWLLNGAHSVLAYGASILGHETVADAIADPRARAWVEEWWEAASRHLRLPAEEVAGYRDALLARFSNASIRHLLAQIAADGSQKVPIRAVPVIAAELAQDRVEPGATRMVAAWVAHLRGHGAPVTDTRAEMLQELVAGSVGDAVDRVLGWLDLDAPALHDVVVEQVTELESASGSGT